MLKLGSNMNQLLDQVSEKLKEGLKGFIGRPVDINIVANIKAEIAETFRKLRPVRTPEILVMKDSNDDAKVIVQFRKADGELIRSFDELQKYVHGLD